MSLLQSIGQHKKATSWAIPLLLGTTATIVTTSALKSCAEKQNEKEWATMLKAQEMKSRYFATQELWYNNVLEPDVIAFADALKAYYGIKPAAQQKMEESKPKIEEAEHNLQKKIDSLEAVQKLDYMLLNGVDAYLKSYNYNFARENHIKDYNSVDERYKDVTGRNLSDDIDSLLAK